MNERVLLSLNAGQHMLFSYLCISIQGIRGYSLDQEDLVEILNQVIELTKLEYYEDITDCPDYQMMVNPDHSYEIFCDFWEENETYFSELCEY